MKHLLYFLLITITFTSCNSSDDDPILPPELSAETTTYELTFFTESQIELIVNWNNNPGDISLSTSIPGVSLDPNTNTIHLRKTLPLGANYITAVAENEGGTATLNLEVENKFAGNFVGAYNGDVNDTTSFPDDIHMITFNEDGSGVYEETAGNQVPIAWIRTNYEINTIVSGSQITYLNLILSYDEDTASLAGIWGYGNTFDNDKGNMRLTLVE